MRTRRVSWEYSCPTNAPKQASTLVVSCTASVAFSLVRLASPPPHYLYPADIRKLLWCPFSPVYSLNLAQGPFLGRSTSSIMVSTPTRPEGRSSCITHVQTVSTTGIPNYNFTAGMTCYNYVLLLNRHRSLCEPRRLLEHNRNIFCDFHSCFL